MIILSGSIRIGMIRWRYPLLYCSRMICSAIIRMQRRWGWDFNGARPDRLIRHTWPSLSTELYLDRVRFSLQVLHPTFDPISILWSTLMMSIRPINLTFYVNLLRYEIFVQTLSLNQHLPRVRRADLFMKGATILSALGTWVPNGRA